MNGPHMRPLLAIETSGSSLGVALHTDQGVVFERDVTAGSIHGRALAPLIDECLRNHGLSVDQLEAVAVSVGPGSWTGLRIGITAAKTLAWSAGIGLVAVPSFEALAIQALPRVSAGTPVMTLRDARSDGVFAAIFCETSGRLERWMPESVLSLERAVTEPQRILEERGSSSLALCGDGVCMEALSKSARERELELKNELENVWVHLPDSQHISGRALAEAGWRRLLAGEVKRAAEDIHKAAPLYLRASGPELKLKAKLAQPG